MKAEIFDLTNQAAILKALDLRRPQYLPTAAYGHFGREKEGFLWEETGNVARLWAMFSRSLVQQ